MNALSIYNQDLVDDATFVDNFVAREKVLEQIIAGLRHIASGGETEHQILIGMRGMGKTSMLRRVAIAIGADEGLKAVFVPLSFREEQYNVITLDTFWRNCAEALAEWCEENENDDLAGRIDRAVESPNWRDHGKAAEGLLAFCRELGRRPCLLVDNLDLILDNLKKEGWEFRNVLQRDDGPIVIGAATEYLRQASDREEPFYEFFHPILLEPLSELELLHCMHALAHRRGEVGKPVKEVLAKTPERIRTLYTLTGGNPRVLAMIYRLLEQAESDKILDDLKALLDEVTPFYKARIEEFQAPQVRAIIDAIALHWDPIKSGELSAITGIPATTISSQLTRLIKTGFIQQVETSGSYSGYQLSERFLNIWYLMRHGTRRAKQRLRWLIIFLTRLFTEEELGQMASRADTHGWHADFRTSVHAACDELKANKVSIASLSFPVKDVEIKEKIMEMRSGEDTEAPQESKMNAEALSLREAGQQEKAIALWSAVANRFQDNLPLPQQLQVCQALLDKAITLGELGRPEEEIAVYDDIIVRFATSDAPAIWEKVARALANKAITAGQLGRREEAIAICNEVIARFATSDTSGIQEIVARAIFNKGITIGRLGQREEAIAVYDEVIACFATSDLPDIQEIVVRALISKGITIGQLGRSEEEIAVYDEVIARFATSDTPDIQEGVARALLFKGITLGQLGRSEEEIAVYDDVIVRFVTSDTPDIQENVVRALISKGIALGQLGRSEEEIIVYDEVIARFATSDTPNIQENVARALVNKGEALGQLERSEEEIAVYDDVIARFATSDAPDIQECVVRALVSKGIAFGQLERREEEIAVYDEVIARFATSDTPEIQEHVAWALLIKGVSLRQLERSEEAIAVFEEVIARFATSEAPDIQESVARARVNKGITLGQLGRREEAIAVYDDIIARFATIDTPNIQENVARALANKGAALGQLGRREEAIAVYDEIIARFATSDTPDIQEHVAWTLFVKGISLRQLERSEEAIAVFDDIIARSRTANSGKFQNYSAYALGQKGRLLIDRFGRYDEAEVCFQQALKISPSDTESANLVWALIGQGRADDAKSVRDALIDTSIEGLALMDAGIELMRDNLGNAFDRIRTALDLGLNEEVSPFFEDIIWLLRIGTDQGHGTRLIKWFVESGNSDRYKPIYVALAAYVHGQKMLLDVNPEVRSVAQRLYDQMSAPKRYRENSGEANGRH